MYFIIPLLMCLALVAVVIALVYLARDLYFDREIETLPDLED